jgi:hypothetical protein
MSRTAKARLTPAAMERLNRGEIVIINVPPGVSQLQLSTRDGDIFAIFNGIFKDLFRGFFGRSDKRFSEFLK